MTDEISPELFQHLVELAALELNQAEGDYLRREMNNQLRAIREVAAIPLDANLPIASHGVSYTSANSADNRDDKWKAYPSPENLLAQAPETDEGYIVVPEIPHKDLD